MPGVGFFGMLIIGILAGYIAEKVTSSDHGLLTNLLGRHRRLVRRRHARQSPAYRILRLARQFDRGLDRRHPRVVDLAEPQGPPPQRKFESAVMVTVLDRSDRCKARPRHPEKARLPDTPVLPKPAWIRVKAPGAHAFDATRDVLARASPRHRVRGGGLPQYRRVLGQAPRHLHDHGRHLHAGLRLLQCAHRASPARSMRASRRASASAVAALGLAHVVVTSVDRDDLADGGAAHFAATIRAISSARARRPASRC